MLQQFILVVHLLLALLLIGLVLVQHGKGADAGAAFGSGASSTVFGSAGSTSFLYKLTLVVAGLFAVTSISLTLLANRSNKMEDLTEKLRTTPVLEGGVPPAPAADVPEVPQ